MVVSIYCDYYQFYRKTNGTKGYYFDQRRMNNKEKEIAVPNQNSGFEINGLRIK